MTLGEIRQENADKLEVPVSLQKLKWLLHAALSGTLWLLMVLSENFMESDVKTPLKTLNGSSIKDTC